MAFTVIFLLKNLFNIQELLMIFVNIVSNRSLEWWWTWTSDSDNSCKYINISINKTKQNCLGLMRQSIHHF